MEPPSASPSGPPSLASLMEGFTRLSKLISGVLVSGYLLQLLFPDVRMYLGLVPGRVLPQIWQVFTSGYLETSFFGMVVDVLVLLFTARHLEPVWGSQEFLKFILVVNTSVCCGVFFLSFFAYIFSRDDTILYTPLGGFQGVVAGFLVAIKQLLPEQEMALFGVFKFRAAHLPAFFVVMSMATALMGGGLDAFAFTVLGTYNAWYYLRFWQSKPGGGLRGDPNEAFAFASFFPEPVQPVVNNFSVQVTGYMAQGIRPSAGHAVGGSLPLPGSDAVEATRRRWTSWRPPAEQDPEAL